MTTDGDFFEISPAHLQRRHTARYLTGMTLSIALILLAIAVLIVANIWMVVAGFRVSLLWGLLNLFLSPAQLVFLFVHWEEARKPFFCSLAGLLLMIPAVVLNIDQITAPDGFLAQTVMAEVRKQMEAEAAKGATAPTLSLEEREAALLQRAIALRAKHDALQAQWAQLAPGDQAARAAFDAEAAQYAAMRKQVEAEKAEVEALRSATPR